MTLKWLPNAICIGRVILVAPIVLMLLEGQYLAALALIGVAAFSDAVDGFLARNFDWRTRLGGLLDPAADKLLVFSVFLTLTYLELVPLFLTVLGVSRDIVIIAGAVTYQVLIEPIQGDASPISKLNTAAQFVFVISTLTGAAIQWPTPQVVMFLGAVVVFTSITSGLNYVVGWGKRAWRKTHVAQ